MSSTGVLSGHPQAFNNSFTVTASGPNGIVSKLFTLVINPTATAALAITTTTLNDVVTGNGVTTGLAGTGGAPPYTWALDSGTLPPGISFVTSGGDYASNLGTGLPFLIGRAMQPGGYTFTLRLTDHDGATATRTFTWNVSRLAYQSTVLPLSGTTLVYNQAYTQTLLALGGTGTYTNWTNLSIDPPGSLWARRTAWLRARR